MNQKTLFNDTELAFKHLKNQELKQRRRLFRAMRSSLPLVLGLRTVRFLVKWVVGARWLVRQTLFPHFCGGERKEQCLTIATRLGKQGIRCTLDYSVEHEGKPKDYEQNHNEMLDSLEWAARHPALFPFVVVKLSSLARTSLMTKAAEAKAAAKASKKPPSEKLLSEADEAELNELKERLNHLCSKAKQNKVRLFIDAEEAAFQPTIDDLANAMILAHNKQQAVVFTTFQLYRRDALAALKKLHESCVADGVVLGAKLVRGAYMEQENQLAKKQGTTSPIHPSKELCDADYDAALRYCVEHLKTIAFCAATHNEPSTDLVRRLMDELSVERNHPNVHFSQLYGMGDTISYELGRQGYNVTKYLPYGPVELVVPYLYRRMQENSSIRGQGERELRHIQSELTRRRQRRRQQKR